MTGPQIHYNNPIIQIQGLKTLSKNELVDAWKKFIIIGVVCTKIYAMKRLPNPKLKKVYDYTKGKSK